MMVFGVLMGLLALQAPGEPPGPSPDLADARPGPRQTLLEQIVGRPTGRNGYEEFLVAAERMRDPRTEALFIQAFGRPRTLGPLREFAAAARPALKIVREGLRKPVFEPRPEINVDTLLPEYAEFRDLARAFAAETEVRFANGEPREAVRALLYGLKFSQAIACSVLITDLVAVACQNILLGAVERHLSAVPEPDTQLLIDHVDSLLARQPAWLGTMERELDAIAGTLEAALARPDGLQEWLQVFYEPPPEVVEAQNASPVREAAILRQVLAAFADLRHGFRRLAAEPEASWLEPPVVFDLPDPLASHVVNVTVPILSTMMQIHARQRTQYRLLRLHAGIQQFRWRNFRLPNDLAELRRPEWIADPLTNKALRYRLIESVGYELYSEGTPGIGRIDLWYRHPVHTEEPTSPDAP